ncbi:MAG: Peptidase family [Candidatus Parcubacteria bacterium]
MIKYLIHGGNYDEPLEINDSYLSQLTIHPNNRGNKVLLIYFAHPKTKWTELFEKDKKRITKLSSIPNLEFKVAEESTITYDIEQANYINIRGGDSFRLLDFMSKVGDIKPLFQNKVVAGVSAGAYMLSKYFYSNDYQKLGSGLGLLNIKTYCHYNTTDIDIITRLAKYKEDLPLLILPSYTFVTILD